MATRGMNYVLDPISAFGKEVDFASMTTSFGTDAGAGDAFLRLDVRGMNDKTILFKNTGANSMNVKILASIDAVIDPALATYDIEHLASTAVGAAAQDLRKFADYYNFILIQLESGSGTVAELKVAATGN